MLGAVKASPLALDEIVAAGTTRLDGAMNSGRELIVSLRICGAADYLSAETVAFEIDDIDRIVATPYKLAYKRS